MNDIGKKDRTARVSDTCAHRGCLIKEKLIASLNMA
jgi:hypothetical protein